ncbi:MAG TPA: VCBS repeat-containing protein [Kofleriaceae bacterium]|nr:VCBS repeat-containing protein [Kofleriaceae bacterium]
MRFLGIALVAAGGLANPGCGGGSAVVIEIRADGLEAPGDIDAFCLAVGDQDPGGGEFAQVYALGGEVPQLPQTLTVDPGSAASAFAWVRGYRRGVELARDSAEVSFDGGEVALTLARCPGGPGGEPRVVADAALPDGSLAALSVGRTGSALVAVGEGQAEVLGARDDQLAALEVAVPAVGAGAVLDLVAFDADGDCDDDVLVVTAGAAPALWQRQADGSFVELAGALGAAASSAAAAADLDGDADIDVALGRADGLDVWLNDGGGQFDAGPAAEGDGATDVVRLAADDLDGDGAVDLVAGRGATEPAPTRVLFNDGTGALATAAAALPEVPFKVRALALRDLDGDGFADLVIAGEEMSVHLYVNRSDGRLEDLSFVRLPTVDPVDAVSIAAGDWDGDCFADLVIGLAGGGEPLSWRGSEAGELVEDGSAAAAGEQVLFGDGDDDGDLDLFAIEGGAALGWAAR